MEGKYRDVNEYKADLLSVVMIYSAVKIRDKKREQQILVCV